jgi:hypothetical protein
MIIKIGVYLFGGENFFDANTSVKHESLHVVAESEVSSLVWLFQSQVERPSGCVEADFGVAYLLQQGT